MDPKDEVSNNPPPAAETKIPLPAQADENPLPAEETVITPQFVPVDTGENELRRMPVQTGVPVPWWTWMVPGARRAHQMRNLQAGTAEVMQLVRSIHQNLEHQVETQRLLVSSLSALPEAVEGLRNIGRATEAQREMMGALQRQMTANAGTMDRFNDTLASMDGTTKSVAERAKSSEAALFDLLRRAQRRMTMLTVLLVITIAGVAGLAGYLLTGGKLPNLRLDDASSAVVTPPPAPAAPIETAPAAEIAPAAETPPVIEPPPAPSEVPAAVVEPAPPAPVPPTPEASVSETPAPEVPAEETPAPAPPAPEAPEPEAPPPEAPVAAEAATVTPASEPTQPTEASLRLEKLLQELRQRGAGAPPDAPQSPPLKP